MTRDIQRELTRDRSTEAVERAAHAPCRRAGARSSKAADSLRKRIVVGVLGVTMALPAAVFGQGRLKTGLQALPGRVPPIAARARDIQYEFDLSQERFYIHVPPNYSTTTPFGILVFASPGDDTTGVPPGWEAVLQRRRLIYIAPQKIGNNQPVARRVGLTVVSAYKLTDLATIDAARVYVAGLSGGARVASWAAFTDPRLFAGVVAVCGAEFCRKVPRVLATRTDEYGYFATDQPHADAAKLRVKFALVTGVNDFRYGNIRDIYEGGFRADGYQAKLFDVPGMGHTICSGAVLEDACQWLEQTR